VRLILAATLWLTPVHSFYSSQCCGREDCHPVPCEELVEDRGGKWVYTPTHNVFGPEQVFPSQDKNCHVCLSKDDKRSLCAYIQQGV
jgi:hypothetical protein